MQTHTFQLPPFSIEVDGCRVDIIEVLKRELVTGETVYFVSVRINYKGIQSRVFPLLVRGNEDLINKLKVEITKVKFIEYAYGIEEVKRLIT